MSHGKVKLSADKLRTERQNRGWSLDRLAGLTEGRVSARQLLDYEHGRRSCDPETFALLCRVLEVDGSALSPVKADEVGLEDLRHWAGLTAERVAQQLGFSRWSLLRAEKTGGLPAGTDETVIVEELAILYGRTPALITDAFHRART